MTEITKTLYRLPKRGQITGVCAGLADYFDLDATLVRLIFVIMAFATGGAVVLLYIILSIILPVDRAETDETISEKAHQLGHDLNNSKVISRVRNYLGIGLLAIGLWLLIGQFWPQILNLHWQYIWPILLIIVGLLVIIRKRK